MMEAARTSETSVNFYQTTRRYNPEDSHLPHLPIVIFFNSSLNEVSNIRPYCFFVKMTEKQSKRLSLVRKARSLMAWQHCVASEYLTFA
jgi:hypothetical protein